MNISATLVKELRERTGAGMMECKKALTETQGDIEAAIEHMRKAGMAKADKKAGRIAAEGLVMAMTDSNKKTAVIAEVNCETDFVAKGDDFKGFVKAVTQCALDNSTADIEALGQLPIQKGGITIEDTRRALIAKIGENISVRRVQLINTGANGVLGIYMHGTRIGVVTLLEGGTEELAKDVAMHVAASRPVCVSKDEIPAATLAKEREIYLAQTAESGKPKEIIEKMVEGRVKKFMQEVTLLGQPFVKNPDVTVEKLLADAKAKAKSFVRFEVGEGIEKKVDNFVQEVMAQARGG
ncbi:MAG: translation elongation factor Ts [Gammaproteobacteria bacterium]|nr:translation elongation factor Ts [Gammaproteobacteria bacterium]